MYGLLECLTICVIVWGLARLTAFFVHRALHRMDYLGARPEAPSDQRPAQDFGAAVLFETRQL